MYEVFLNCKIIDSFCSYQKKILSMEVELEKEKELYRSKAQKLYEKISNKIIAEYEGKLQRAKAEYVSIFALIFLMHFRCVNCC